jgi:predicted AAA+ superfamily ATPase
MRTIPKEQVIHRLRFENPWWQAPHAIPAFYRSMRPRAYFNLFAPLAMDTSVRRAMVLMGPRRVGKTVMLFQVIQQLIDQGVNPERLCYVSVEHPMFNGLGLEELLALCRVATASAEDEPIYVFFDEIQYLKDWEVHLKSLVDSYPQVKCVVSGSAAAALRLKSIESGAGRFTDFLLPPLTFHEYLELLGKSELIDQEGGESGRGTFTSPDIHALNDAFLHYLNFGGYPEAIFSPTIQSDPGRFIRSDIIDKVLLRDLPELYGIHDIQELNSLFTLLAFNTAGELALEGLSQRSGVAKNTIKKYIEYLEAAFLLRRVHRIDHHGKRFERERTFKIYLTNPSIRSALFAPTELRDPEIGSLVETAVFSQWLHNRGENLYYARWGKDQEVDLAFLDAKGETRWALEVKWSDRCFERPGELGSLVSFCKRQNLSEGLVTTLSTAGTREVDGVDLNFVPASLYCYTVGYNIVTGFSKAGMPASLR